MIERQGGIATRGGAERRWERLFVLFRRNLRA